MTTINNPGAKRFRWEKNFRCRGVRMGPTADAAWAKAAAALTREEIRLDQDTNCAIGYHGPYWKTHDRDVYVFECEWVWWIIAQCKSHAKLDVTASCVAFTLEDAISKADS